MMMRVKNHHTPPTIRPDNDLGNRKRKREGGGIKRRDIADGLEGREECRDKKKKGGIWRGVEPGGVIIGEV